MKNELQMCYITSEEWTTNVLYKQVKNELQMCYINKWRMNYKCVI